MEAKSTPRKTLYCPRCKSNRMSILGETISASGASQYGFSCLDCGSPVASNDRLWIPKEEIISKGYKLEDLPVNRVAEQSRCAKCGKRGAERHHWAPKHLFGPDADNWPTDYLCVQCHLDWHNKVTPEMSK